MKISEGNNNQYLIHGVAIVIVCGVAMVFTEGWIRFLILLIMLVSSVALFSAKNGFEIDPQTRRYRKYGQIGTFYFGQWENFPDARQVKVQIHADNSQVKGMMPGGNGQFLARTASVKVITYDVILVTSKGELEIYSSMTYKVARKILKAIVSEFELDGRDLVAEKLAENRAKRGRR